MFPGYTGIIPDLYSSYTRHILELYPIYLAPSSHYPRIIPVSTLYMSRRRGEQCCMLPQSIARASLMIWG